MNIYLGDYLLKYLTSDHYRLSPDVIESFIVSPQKSLLLYHERQNDRINTMYLYYNPNMDSDFLTHVMADPMVFVDFDKVSLLLPLDGDYIEANRHFPWSYDFLAQNKHISSAHVALIAHGRSPEDIATRPSKKGYDLFAHNVLHNARVSVWTCRKLQIQSPFTVSRYILRSKLTTIDDFEYVREMQSESQRKSFFRSISGNHNLTMDYIRLHANEDWDWHMLSSNPSFSVQEILDPKNREWPMKWKFTHLSMHPRLTIDVVLKNPTIPWHYKFVCVNKNITVHDLEKLPAEIFDSLFEHRYIFWNEYWDRELFEKYHQKYQFSESQIFLMYTIKRSWVRTSLCKKKIQEVYYDELMSFTWKPSRLADWIWDTDFLREWDSMLPDVGEKQ